MDATVDRSFEKLILNLDDLVGLYRQLLDLARKEKQYLIDADTERILEVNTQKDVVLQKVKLADTLRFKHAKELCLKIGADNENPRLLEIAQRLHGPKGDKLHNFHSTLEMVIKRIIEINKDNEELAKKAKARFEELIFANPNKLVKVECGDFDKYGRILVTVWNNVNEKYTKFFNNYDTHKLSK